jgi:predicted Mrr-cat superfamily restriction endonuclease
MNDQNYYLIRVGEGSKYIDEAHKNGFVAIGWNEVPDLRKLGSFDKIKKALKNTTYQYSQSQLPQQAGQLARFGFEIKNGDIILSPLGNGEYLVGTVGDYFYEENPDGYCNYKHRRKVQWQERTISKEDMSTSLSYSVGAIMTIFSLNKYSKELDMLKAGQTYTPAEKPQRIRDIVLEGLLDLNAKEFEEFIRHVLEIIGFSAETTQYVGDKGIDVSGILDAEGLANITLQVQAKRKNTTIGNKDVLALRGALSQGEHGCLITLSKFTKQAVEEAQAPGKILIKLIDGNDLAGLILKHFDEVDDDYKKRFGIRRKKDFNIEDQFEPADQKETETLPEIIEEKIKKPEWDTLLCAAQEDGFKRAFLDEHAWWAVRLNSKTIPFIKYLAIYQVAPVSKITYYAEVDRIEPYLDTGKYRIILKNEPVKLKNPVGLGTNPHLKPQGPKYASLDKILKATTLDDVF